MKKCEIVKLIRGQHAVDGAGVHMVRVLSQNDMREFDPFLMLDTFDTVNPADYIAGFPTHPHRGIETVTYLISGRIDHEDSLGNKGAIISGESQWMTAGSGILHQEMPQPPDRMLGFQLWLNMPKAEKMADPAYLSITKDMIPVVQQDKASVRVLSGAFKDAKGVTPHHVSATIYDVSIKKGGEIDIPVNAEETAFVFLIEGDAVINEKQLSTKTAVLFDKGDYVHIAAPADADTRLIYFSGKPLHEPIAWGGPIVMNTDAELQHAFNELRRGTFIKHG